MPELILFISTGLLVYWVARTWLLLRGAEEEIDETLETDLWWGRRLLLSLRALLVRSEEHTSELQSQ